MSSVRVSGTEFLHGDSSWDTVIEVASSRHTVRCVVNGMIPSETEASGITARSWRSCPCIASGWAVQ